MSFLASRASASAPGTTYGGPAYTYSGTGVPNAALGNNGDVYIRVDGSAGAFLYQKRSGAWVASSA